MKRDCPAIAIEPASELARILMEAHEPVVLERNGVRYRVQREPEALFANDDPERVRDALRQSAGALAGVDASALKRDRREQQAQDTRGRPR